MAQTEEPVFRFGLISDTQYCDADDGTNFGGTRTRRCRTFYLQPGCTPRTLPKPFNI